ncbi:hypothetical protein GGR56DRAFT_670076 [Xylariaceae sp. FL0804]|nr:hypothetical protein GGR56DRAFT_670076 [Xylariaceae sp. FL0804]
MTDDMVDLQALLVLAKTHFWVKAAADEDEDEDPDFVLDAAVRRRAIIASVRLYQAFDGADSLLQPCEAKLNPKAPKKPKTRAEEELHKLPKNRTPDPDKDYNDTAVTNHKNFHGRSGRHNASSITSGEGEEDDDEGWGEEDENYEYPPCACHAPG